MSTMKTCQPTTATHEDRWTVFLSGDVDASSASELRSLAELLSACRGEVDLNLGGVTFIDSRGWARVRATADAVKAAGSPVRIVNPSLAVRRLTDSVARAGTRRPDGRGRAGLRLIWSAERPPGIDGGHNRPVARTAPGVSRHTHSDPAVQPPHGPTGSDPGSAATGDLATYDPADGRVRASSVRAAGGRSPLPRDVEQPPSRTHHGPPRSVPRRALVEA